METPLLERLKFLAISSSNLDEFFMIRVASLNRFRSQAPRDPGPKKIYSTIIREAERIYAKQSKILAQLGDELNLLNIHIHRRWDSGPESHGLSKVVFLEQVFPHLNTPERYNHRQLKKLDNLSMGVWFPSGYWTFVPKAVSTVYYVEKNSKSKWIFFLDELIALHLGTAFGISGNPGIVRLTRDADINIDLEEEDTESIPDLVKSQVGSRERGRPVRLQYVGNLPKSFLDEACIFLRVDRMVSHRSPQPLTLHGLWFVINQIAQASKENSKLLYPPIVSSHPKPFSRMSGIFDYLKKQDILLHHPYDSFDSFVKWIEEACKDRLVERIELTIYRMDAVSLIVESLKKVGRQKKIRALIELRARFDERNNLRLAEELREAGVEVGFVLGKLKLHAKVALVVRKEGGESKIYTHLSTGNYNAVTARQYTDLAILTADPEMGSDAQLFFEQIWNGKLPGSFKKLVTAPTKLHRRILRHIENEIRLARKGLVGRIFAKVNALVDDEIIGRLYDASRNGVQVDLVVRGACALIPGIPGVSENIRVYSIVDRFLEHSRIYYFQGSQSIYLSSADWMPRNFFSRLEIAFSVLDPLIKEYLIEKVIPVYLNDTVKGWELCSNAKWKRRESAGGKPGLRSQKYFQKPTE